MIKFIEANWSGKGFITHADQQVNDLSFKYSNGLVEVSGAKEDINKWMNRVSGVEMTEKAYHTQKAQMEKSALEDRLGQLEVEKTNLQTKLAGTNNTLNNLK